MSIFNNSSKVKELERELRLKDDFIKSLKEELDICNNKILQLSENKPKSKSKTPKPIVEEKSLDSESVDVQDNSNIINLDELQVVKNRNTNFKGKKFVITGVFRNYSRESLADFLIELGGIRRTSFNKSINILIAGMDPGPSKMDLCEEMIENGMDVILLYEIDLNLIFRKNGLKPPYDY